MCLDILCSKPLNLLVYDMQVQKCMGPSGCFSTSEKLALREVETKVSLLAPAKNLDKIHIDFVPCNVLKFLS